MFPIYCKHCGQPTGRWKEAQDTSLAYLQDHCRECLRVPIVQTESGPLTLPCCVMGILGCRRGTDG